LNQHLRNVKLQHCAASMLKNVDSTLKKTLQKRLMSTKLQCLQDNCDSRNHIKNINSSFIQYVTYKNSK